MTQEDRIKFIEETLDKVKVSLVKRADFIPSEWGQEEILDYLLRSVPKEVLSISEKARCAR